MFIKLGQPVNSTRYRPVEHSRSNLPPQEDPGEWIEVEGDINALTYYDKKDKVLITYPAKPNPLWEFDYEKQVWAPVVETKTEASRLLRYKRDRLMKECDWVVLRAQEQGNVVDQAWLVYRQALRDITEQPGAPYNVEWPTKPTE